MTGITAQAKQNIQGHLDEATGAAAGKNRVPGLVFCAVDKTGAYLTQQESGVQSNVTNAPMTQDSVFWIASCTKMVTGLACMQLAEQGRLELDSSAQLYQLCPEIAAKREVLVGPGKWEPRKGEITVRMLLSHTAGFGYSFFNERLRDFGRPTGLDEFSGDFKDYERSPLVNQPGSRWEYGANIDWAGVAVERLTGLRLGEYFQRHIFTPLGIKDMSFLPDKHMRDNLVSVHQRLPGGDTIEMDHPQRRAIFHADGPEADKIFHSGGAGLFAKPKEYVKILAALLNDGVSPTTGGRILKPETVKEMFTNQVPQFPRFAYEPIPASKPLQTNPLPQIFPQEGNPDQGWGLTMHLTEGPVMTGRGTGSGWWAGIVNLYWWCDRESGLAGIIAAGLFPFGDPTCQGAWLKSEGEIYAGRQAAKM